MRVPVLPLTPKRVLEALKGRTKAPDETFRICPRRDTEAEALELLAEHGGNTAVLAGGTDLLDLMKGRSVAPARVVDIKHIRRCEAMDAVEGACMIGAIVTLDEMVEHPALQPITGRCQVIDGVRSMQIQNSGDPRRRLCHAAQLLVLPQRLRPARPRQRRIAGRDGRQPLSRDLGNHGPAKFVNASRFAPALIAWGAKVRVIGPNPSEEQWLPLEFLYLMPQTSEQSPLLLKPGQLISHMWLPDTKNRMSATYEVLQLEGLDWPLAAAACTLDIEGGRDSRRENRPRPRGAHSVDAQEAARLLVGQTVTEESAQRAGEMAVARATPLSMNDYKIQLSRTAVKRAILKAAGQWF